MKAVELSRTRVTLAVGGKSTIKAGIVKLYPELEISNHVNPLRYYTSNAAVATVTARGVIKAVGLGRCKVVVVAPDGTMKSVTVTVK